MKFTIKKSDKLLIIIIIILINSYLLVKVFSFNSEPLLMDYAKNSIINVITSLINNSINNIIYENNIDDLILLEKNNNNEISNVNFNNRKINEILYEVNNELLSNIKKVEEGKLKSINSFYLSDNDIIYYIPIGIVHNSVALNNIGPKIPFKIRMIGSIDNNTEINVKDYGINSSIIELYLNIAINVQVIMPFKSDVVIIKKKILLESKIIQGQIPEYYGGIISNPLTKNK